MLIDDIGGIKFPAAPASHTPSAPSQGPLVRPPSLEYLLDVNFSSPALPSPQELAQFVAPTAEPGGDELDALAALAAPRSGPTPLDFAPVDPLAPTPAQQNNRLSLNNVGSWNPWTVAASSSSGGKQAARVAGADIGLAVDAARLGSRVMGSFAAGLDGAGSARVAGPASMEGVADIIQGYRAAGADGRG